MAGGNDPTVVAVVVTYNRRQLLLEALARGARAEPGAGRGDRGRQRLDRRDRRGGARALSVRAAGRADAQHRRRGRVRLRHGAGAGRRRGPHLVHGRRHGARAGRAAGAAGRPRTLPRPAPRAGRQPCGLDRRAGAPDEHPAQQAVRRPGQNAWRPRRRAACRSVRHRLSRSSWTPGCAAGAACRRRTTSCGTTTSSSPPGCCAATPACSARPASSCTRRRRSARRTPTPGSASSTRSGTRSGCSGIRRAARARRAGGVHRLDAAPLGTHLRALTRPAHARSLTCQGHRRRGADETAADRGGARGGRPGPGGQSAAMPAHRPARG